MGAVEQQVIDLLLRAQDDPIRKARTTSQIAVATGLPVPALGPLLRNMAERGQIDGGESMLLPYKRGQPTECWWHYMPEPSHQWWGGPRGGYRNEVEPAPSLLD